MCHRLLFVMDLFCSLCCLPFCRLSCCRRPKSEFLRGVRDIKDCLGCALDSVEKRRLPKVPDEDKDNDHHDELLVVSPHRRVSISDSTAEMASILCHVILLLSVMTQHLYSHWYFFSSSSTNHNQTTIHMRLSSKRIQVRSAFIATVGCCSFDFVLVVFGCASCMDSHVN